MSRLFDQLFDARDRWIDALRRGQGPVADVRLVHHFGRELHRPGHRRRTPIELAVDKVGAASEKEPDRRHDPEIIRQTEPREAMSPRVIHRESDQPDDAAVARHSALPDAQQRERIADRLVKAIEQDVAQASADDDAKECGPHDEIVHLCHRQSAVAMLRQPAQQEKSADEREHVRSAVPAQSEVLPDLKNERAEVVDEVSDQAGQATRDA